MVVLVAGAGRGVGGGAAEGSPGPGVATLLVHAVVAVVAVLAQVFADRTAGPWGALAAAGVIVTVGAVLTVEWLV